MGSSGVYTYAPLSHFARYYLLLHSLSAKGMEDAPVVNHTGKGNWMGSAK